MSVVCCQVDVSANSLSLVPRSPTGCGASMASFWSQRHDVGGDIYVYFKMYVKVHSSRDL